jgi:hypothetical protein
MSGHLHRGRASRRSGNLGRARACIGDDPAAMKTLRKLQPSFLDRAGYNAALALLWESGGCGYSTDFERAIQELDAALYVTKDRLYRAAAWLLGTPRRDLEHLRDACRKALDMLLGLRAAPAAT